MRDDLFTKWHLNNPPSPPLQHPSLVPGVQGLQLIPGRQSMPSAPSGRSSKCNHGVREHRRCFQGFWNCHSG
jgi:hypothetical protein